MSSRPGTARNVLLMFLTQFATWAVTFVVMIFVPRYLGAVGLGKLSYVSSTVGLFGVLVSLGTGTVMIRSVSRDHSSAPSYLINSYVMSVPLALLAGCLAYGVSCFRHNVPSTRVLIAVGALGLVTGVFSNTNYNVLQGLERFSKQNIASIADKYLNSLLLVGLVILKAKLWMLVLINPVCNVISFLFSATFLRDVFAAAKSPRLLEIRQMVIIGLPFLGFSIFRNLYGQTDPLIIAQVSSFQSVGWYSAAAKLLGTTMIIPSAVSTVMLPVMSRQFQNDKVQFNASIFRFYKLMALTGLPITLVTYALAGRMLQLLHYGPSFNNAIPVLQVGSITILLCFIAMPFGYGVISSDKQVQLMLTALLATVVFLPTCYFLCKLTTQMMGNAAIGAIISDGATELVIITCYIKSLPKGCVTMQFLVYGAKCIAASLPMVGILLLGKSHPAYDIVFAALALIVYAGAAWFLGCVQPEDIGSMKNMLSAKLSKPRTEEASVV